MSRFASVAGRIEPKCRTLETRNELNNTALMVYRGKENKKNIHWAGKSQTINTHEAVREMGNTREHNCNKSGKLDR